MLRIPPLVHFKPHDGHGFAVVLLDDVFRKWCRLEGLPEDLGVERLDGGRVHVEVTDASGVVPEVLGEELLGPLGDLGVGPGGGQASKVFEQG